MRPWFKRSLIAVFGASILAFSFSACAQRDHHARFGQVSAEDAAKWRGKLIERAGKELTLDDAQKQRLGTLFDKMNEQRGAFLESKVGTSSDPRDTLRQLVAGDKFDRSKASALVTEKTDAVRNKSPEVITAAADFFDVLKPEQQAKVREYMNTRRGRWMSRG